MLKTDGSRTDQSALDAELMQRCIRLSATAITRGEFPFAALICRDGEVIVETTNQVVRDSDVTRHAELVAISEAQKLLDRKDLVNCTLYSNVEPCPMCAFPIRETHISRVVFAMRSPVMGGLSKWNVLRDPELSRVMPEIFGPVPEVIAGLLQREAETVWATWHPLIWRIIRYRGCFGAETAADYPEYLKAIPARGGWLRRLLALHHHGRSA